MVRPLIGTICLHTGKLVPRNWAHCTGQLIYSGHYTALFAVLGDKYGGDLENYSTYALPDLRHLEQDTPGGKYLIAICGESPENPADPPREYTTHQLQMQHSLKGTIILFGGSFAPRGWAFCEGQLLHPDHDSHLFDVIGTRYGGDGITTFALPNLAEAEKIFGGARFIISMYGAYPNYG